MANSFTIRVPAQGTYWVTAPQAGPARKNETQAGPARRSGGSLAVLFHNRGDFGILWGQSLPSLVAALL